MDKSEQEKSWKLAKLMGWTMSLEGQILDQDFYGVRDADGRFVEEDLIAHELPIVPDLYDPANMALAWRVLNWASEQQAIIDYCREESFMEDIEQYWSLPPAEAQAAWLDKILELCQTAGIIEVNHETNT